MSVHRFGTSSGSKPGKTHRFASSMAKMSQEKRTQSKTSPVRQAPTPTPRQPPQPSRPSTPVVKSDTVQSLLAVIERKEREEAKLVAQKKQDATDKAAREARLREEDRKAQLFRLSKIPQKDRAAYLENERLLVEGRKRAVELKNKPQKESTMDISSIFGIAMDGD